MKIDRNLIGGLLKSGLQYSQIADRLGVSRQSIHTIAKECYPELVQIRRRQRVLSLAMRREKVRRDHFMKCELPCLVREWLFKAGYARCMTCNEYKCLDLFPVSITAHHAAACKPCSTSRMREWRNRVPAEKRGLHGPWGWWGLTPEERRERVNNVRAVRWGT